MTTAPKPKILLPALLLTLCVGLGIWFALLQRSIVCGGDSCDGPIDALVAKEITLTGTYACLPSEPTNAPPEDVCVAGVQTKDGSYYALDLNAAPTQLPTLSVGDQLTARGIFVPAEALSSVHWQAYPILGIFTVTSISTVQE